MLPLQEVVFRVVRLLTQGPVLPRVSDQKDISDPSLSWPQKSSSISETLRSLQIDREKVRKLLVSEMKVKEF